MPGAPQLPKDFGARVRAARAYHNDASQGDFGAELNRSGMSARTVRNWEHGHIPPTMSQRAIVERLAEVTSLPESFFWGEPSASGDVAVQVAALEARMTEKLTELAGVVEFFRAENASNAAAVLRRIDEALSPTPQTRHQQRA